MPRSQSSRTAALLRAAGDAAVLTVGESPRFLDAGGLINFVVEGGHVRFDINADAAAAPRSANQLEAAARGAPTAARDRREDW